jgi:hypothetical protein
VLGSHSPLPALLAAALAGGGDDPTPNPFRSQGVTWKPGQGIVFADTDEFGLRMAGQLQVQYAFAANENGRDPSSFQVRRARLGFAGHVFDRDLQYALRLDAVDDGAGANGPIKDAFAQWTFARGDGDAVGLRAGQSKPYHGLEATGGSSGLFFVEKSSTTRAFSDARSRGAWLHGAHLQNALRWVAGAQTGDVANGAVGISERGEESVNADGELTFVASCFACPFGDVNGGKPLESWRQGDLGGSRALDGLVGAGVMLGNHRSPLVPDTDVESTSINVNTAWAFARGLTADGEVFLRTDDPQGGTREECVGWYAQGTWTSGKSGGSDTQYGFGLRVNAIDTDDTSTFFVFNGALASAGQVTEYTAVVNAFHHGHACKTQVEYTLQEVDPDAGERSTNHIVRVQLQVLF